MYFFLSSLNGVVKGEYAHLMFVHRLQPGDEVKATNLSGSVASIRIERYDKKTRTYWYTVLSVETKTKQSNRVIFQAMLDKQYLDQCAEILGYTEVDTIILFQAKRSQYFVEDVSRFDRILQRATLLAEQAFSKTIVVVRDQEELQQLIKKYKPAVLSVTGNISIDSHSISNAFCIGPEGGWDMQEREMFRRLGLDEITLGKNVYPGWLAGFVALTLGQSLSQPK